MTGQILPLARPEFSVIIEMTYRDALKALEVKRTTFKRMRHFFTDNNHYYLVGSFTTSPIDHVFVD